MNTRPLPHRQAGYTLIELLLYVAIVGVLLSGVTVFFGIVTDARVKNQAISEVNQQGAAVLEIITQTVRNADSITAPIAGASGASLTLAVPTGSLSPTVFSNGGGTAVLGYDVDGVSTDIADSNVMNASKFTASASGTITTLYARIGATVAPSPNNQAQMAIYSGVASPSTLLASSASVTLTANAWNAFTISSVNVTSGQTYWLVYNTNGLSSSDNNLKYHAGAANQSMWTDQVFGTWPASWSNNPDNYEFSMYATINTAGGSTSMQIKEGTGAFVPLTNDKVQLSAISFKNLSRSGTPGVVQVSFTVSRTNPSGRNEYDYQKTFTATAALRP